MAVGQESEWAGLKLSANGRAYPAVGRFVESLRAVHLNGGACFGSFRFPASGPFLEFARRGELVASGFFDCLWQTEAVHLALPELAAESGFRCGRPFAWGNPFTLDGELASALYCGGAYGQYKGTAAEAKAEAAAPAAELLGRRFERSHVYINHGQWCGYFDGIVDWTWVVLDWTARALHVLAATDVD